MKKQLFYIAGLLSMTFVLLSCNEDIKIWDSNNYEYAGSYLYSITKEDGKVEAKLSSKKKLELYNTASDVKNELWIWDHNKNFPLKSKIALTGNATKFKSKSLNFKDLSNNSLRIEKEYERKGELEVAPTTVGTVKKFTTDRFRCAVVEGKILPKAATSKSGNKCDSIYMKLKFFGADLEFTSYLVPEKERTNPKVEEFAWKLSKVEYNNSKDEVLTISGHRYTGFLEDED